MYRVLPFPTAYVENPLPAREPAQDQAPPSPLTEIPFVVRSRLHSLRNGEPDWEVELELLDAMMPGEFEELVATLLKGLKEPAVSNVIRGWAGRVTAHLAPQKIVLGDQQLSPQSPLAA